MTVSFFTDYAAMFAKLIARTAKDIDVLIDSLPSEESSLELQVGNTSWKVLFSPEKNHFPIEVCLTIFFFT